MESASLPTADSEAWAEQLTESLRAQRDRARVFLAAQQARMEQAQLFVERQIEQLEDELRQLQSENAELRQQLSSGPSMAASQTLSRQPASLSWEAQKQHILAALEADFDQDDKAKQSDRLRIEEVVRTTDEVIAAKNLEIQALQQRLKDLGVDASAVASDVAAANQVLDDDAIVQQERERLKVLQEQLREKLREAEIELAVERAKIARQQAELDDQLRKMANGASEPPPASDASGQAGGRWLSRMGLTAADRRSGRQL